MERLLPRHFSMVCTPGTLPTICSCQKISVVTRFLFNYSILTLKHFIFYSFTHMYILAAYRHYSLASSCTAQQIWWAMPNIWMSVFSRHLSIMKRPAVPPHAVHTTITWITFNTEHLKSDDCWDSIWFMDSMNIRDSDTNVRKRRVWFVIWLSSSLLNW